jgi:hypothetical protein
LFRTSIGKQHAAKHSRLLRVSSRHSTSDQATFCFRPEAACEANDKVCNRGAISATLPSSDNRVNGPAYRAYHQTHQ